MFDLEAIDRLYTASKACRGLLQFSVFDKRVLLPLSQLVDAVKGETGETITEEGLRAKAAAGWFPLLRRAEEDGGEEGAPLYASSRIALLLQLERDGYGADELRLIAELEEGYLEHIWTADDLAYLDDDLETLIQATEARIEALGCSAEAAQFGKRPDLEGLEAARKQRRFLQDLKARGIPEKLLPKIEKAAFRARAMNEFLRMQLVEMDRAKLRAGYGPFANCESSEWSFEGGFKGGPVLWESAIRSALAYTAEDNLPAIRVPGFLLRGDHVAPTRTLRPSEYAALWKERDLDGYLKAWNKLRGDRCCLNCLAPLRQGNDRKQFCGDRCRNAMRQRRFREANPDAVFRTQKRYWDSLR